MVSTGGTRDFTFYCPYCDADYVGEVEESLDYEFTCDECGETFRVEVFVETVIQTSKRLKGEME